MPVSEIAKLASAVPGPTNKRALTQHRPGGRTTDFLAQYGLNLIDVHVRPDFRGPAPDGTLDLDMRLTAMGSINEHGMISQQIAKEAGMPDRKSMLNKIEEGMKVYDNKGGEIGTVEFIHFSEADGGDHPVAAAPSDEPTESDLMKVVRKMFGADNLPRELRERLLMHGFIRMDSAGLFGSDRYVMFDQIAKVDARGVYLGVEDTDGLLKA